MSVRQPWLWLPNSHSVCVQPPPSTINTCAAVNLKLKRLVRTPSSEQYALFDLEQVDVDNLPMTIGKLDLHYTGEGVYGTILLWDEASRRLTSGQRSAFIRALLNEITQPMGVPNEFVVEFFAPTLEDYEVFHNVGAVEESTADGLAELDERRRRLTGAPADDDPE